MSYSWGAGRPARADGLDVVTRDVPVQPTEQRQVADELAPMVDVWQRILVEHVPDRAGRCLVCTKGGTGLPSSPWPCSIYGIAELARRRHDALPS